MTVDEAYLILGIEDPNIDEEELRHIFYNAAHLSHPDSNPENQYAKTKFAMIQEAYNVLKGNVRPSSPENQDRAKAKRKNQKDRWDYFNEADRKYRQMRREEAKKKAAKAFQEQKEAEQRYSAFQKQDFSQHTKQSYRSSDNFSTDYGMSAQGTITRNLNKRAWLDKVSMAYQLFLDKDFMFDSTLILCIGLLLIAELFAKPLGIHGFTGVCIMVLSWLISVLTARKVAKLSSRYVKTTIASVLIFLITLEVLVEVFKLFLF